MPIVSEGYILDSGITDQYTKILFDDNSPLICTLIKVELEKNSNKFYVMHALHQVSKGYVLYSRSGKTGLQGKISEKVFPSKEKCVASFLSTFKRMTANVWSFRDRFEHRMDHYSIFSFGEKTPDFSSAEISESSTSDTFNSIDELLDLLCGEKTTKAAICSLGLDEKKLPIGMVTSRNIGLAREVLSQLQEAILEKAPEEKIIKLCNHFYGFIPLRSAGKLPILSSDESISKKFEELEDLENITRTLQILEKGDSSISNLGSSMNHSIKPILCDDPMYQLIENYMKNSHGTTHHFHLKLLSIYEVRNEKKYEIFNQKYGKSSRRELLIHGSRLCNWRSILERGLQINPGTLSDKITGKMFGHGIYWANSFSKSAQYCPVARGQKEKICLALAEVAVGNQLRLTNGNHTLSLSNMKGYDSVLGMGQKTPSGYTPMSDGTMIPTGKLTSSAVPGSNLFYDETIIYDPDQYHFRYLVIAQIN